MRQLLRLVPTLLELVLKFLNKYNFIFFVLFFNIAFANVSDVKVTKCNFEEIHIDGTINQGLLFYKDQKFRYQYNNLDLYTIILNENLYLIRNREINKFERIKKEKYFFNDLVYLLENFPNVENQYLSNHHKIIIDKTYNEKYPKRIGISSNNVNLSINLFDCSLENSYPNVFKFNPFLAY